MIIANSVNTVFNKWGILKENRNNKRLLKTIKKEAVEIWINKGMKVWRI